MDIGDKQHGSSDGVFKTHAGAPELIRRQKNDPGSLQGLLYLP